MKLAVIFTFYCERGPFSFYDISFRHLQFTDSILEFSRFIQDLHVKKPKLLKSALTFIVKLFSESLYLYYFELLFNLGFHPMQPVEKIGNRVKLAMRCKI